MSRDVRGACALYYSYQVRRADGTITVPFRRRTAHSFLIGYARWLYLKIGSVADQSITDTGGLSRTIVSSSAIDTQTVAGTSTEGLVVGTGTNTVALADTKLQTQIAHGTSAGTLDYGASVVNLPSSDSTSTTLILTRVFANSSGGAITVREIGIYASMLIGSGGLGGTEVKICIVRDLATIALTNGDQLTLNYILKTTA